MLSFLHGLLAGDSNSKSRYDAAVEIQRHYRGYVVRRDALTRGLSLKMMMAPVRRMSERRGVGERRDETEVSFVVTPHEHVAHDGDAKKGRDDESSKRSMSSHQSDSSLRFECKFYFSRAAQILSIPNTGTIPKFQDLPLAWRQQKLVSIKELLNGAYADHLAVSHRWEQPDSPDSEGEQLRAVQEHLRKNDQIEWVWIDVNIRSSNSAPLASALLPATDNCRTDH